MRSSDQPGRHTPPSCQTCFEEVALFIGQAVFVTRTGGGRRGSGQGGVGQGIRMGEGGGLEVITWLGGLMVELIKRGHEGTVRDRARRQPTWIVDRDFNVKRSEPATLPTLAVISEQGDLRHAVGGSGRGLPN